MAGFSAGIRRFEVLAADLIVQQLQLLEELAEDRCTETRPGDLLAEQARTYANEGFDSLWSTQVLTRGFMLTDHFVAKFTGTA